VFYAIYKAVMFVFEEYGILSKWDGVVPYVAAVVAWFVYDIYVQIFAFFVNIMHNCKALEPGDTLFMLDDEVNVSNIMANGFLEKFEFEEMRSYLDKRTSYIDDCRCKLVKRYGQWWYEKMDQKEWDKKKDAVFVLGSGVHTL